MNRRSLSHCRWSGFVILMLGLTTWRSCVTAQEAADKPPSAKPLYSLLAGDISNVLQQHSVVFSPDGKLFAAKGQHGMVWVWDTTTGKRRHLLPTRPGWMSNVVFSPDSKLVA